MSFLSLATSAAAQPQRHLHFPSLVNFHTFLWAAFRMHILTNKQIRRAAVGQARREKGREGGGLCGWYMRNAC